MYRTLVAFVNIIILLQNFSLHNAIRGISYLLELKINYHKSSLIGLHIHTRVPKRFLGSGIRDMKQKEYEIGIESVREMRDYRIERKFVSGLGDEEFMLQFLFFVSPLVFLCSLSPCL